MKLKKGDEIIVTSGKDKGRKGKVTRVYPRTLRVLVPGLNMYKHHVKKRDEKHQGGIIDVPRPLRVGNIALICPKCSQPTRIGYLVSGKEKIRTCRKCRQKI